MPGIVAEVVDKQGKPVPAGQGGFLVVKKPWPAMMPHIFGDDERYKQAITGAKCPASISADAAPASDADGYIWVMGRVDDVLNVAGHRLSTMEVESALVHHPKVAEAAVVGKPDDIKGEAISCFVTLKAGFKASDGVEEKELQSRTSSRRSARSLHAPDEIRFTDSLPKTRAPARSCVG